MLAARAASLLVFSVGEIAFEAAVGAEKLCLSVHIVSKS